MGFSILAAGFIGIVTTLAVSCGFLWQRGSSPSTYNTRPLLAEVLVDGHHYRTIRPRQTPEALLERDVV